MNEDLSDLANSGDDDIFEQDAEEWGSEDTLLTEDEDVNIEGSVGPDVLQTTDGTIINLEASEFSKFYSVFSAYSKPCSEIHIKDGKIAQISNRREGIYCIDLTSLIGTCEMLFINTPKKLELLDPFKRQQVDVQIVIENNNEDRTGKYIIKDEHSALNIAKPVLAYMSNTYMEPEQLENNLKIDNSREFIFEYTLEKYLVERLVSFSRALAATVIRFEFEGTTASLYVTPSDTKMTSSAKLKTFELTHEIEKSTCEFPILPFDMGIFDTMTLTLFYRQDENANIILKIESVIENLPTTVWCISNLVLENDESGPNI